jgi:hypothetical protein
MTLLELNYQRRKAKAEAAGLLDRAVTESRTLSLAEQARFDTLASDMQSLDTAISEREALRKLAL